MSGLFNEPRVNISQVRKASLSYARECVCQDINPSFGWMQTFTDAGVPHGRAYKMAAALWAALSE